MAGGIFRQERRWKTLSTLAMLPMSTRRMAYQKLLGCIPALIPAAFYFGLGLLCVLDEILKGVADNWLHGSRSYYDDLFFVFCYVFSQGILFLHLVVWLSLYLKRGALPMAIAIHFVVHMFLGLVMAAVVRDSGGLVIMAVLSIVASIVLHVKIGARLEELAAED
jgi:hypothetical protein